jgi:hypothetical protein
MINLHYKSRYDRFIDYIRSQPNRDISNTYTEVHHIQPKCLKGSDEGGNLIELTLREHHLAHWLLWKAYPDYLPIASAFLQMNNKNTKNTKSNKNFKPLPSRVYESLKLQTYKMLSELRTDKVYVRDRDGNLIEMSKKEYAEQEELKFHTTGKLVVFDHVDKLHKAITTAEYYNNKRRYTPNVGAGTGGISPHECRYMFLDTHINEPVKITKSSAKKLNAEAGYKRYKQIVDHKISVIDEEGDKYLVSLEQYHSGNYKHCNSDTIKVYDNDLQCYRSVTREEYYIEPGRYNTSTKGKVLAKNANGETILVDKKDFDSGEYVGHTKGLRTAYDAITGKYKQVTEEEWSTNKDRYTGPNKGKINVINKRTGIREQINKADFDSSVHLSLGAQSYLFRAKNRLTNKEKNINIYEWDLVKEQYEIIDEEQFNNAMKKK